MPRAIEIAAAGGLAAAGRGKGMLPGWWLLPAGQTRRGKSWPGDHAFRPVKNDCTSGACQGTFSKFRYLHGDYEPR